MFSPTPDSEYYVRKKEEEDLIDVCMLLRQINEGGPTIKNPLFILLAQLVLKKLPDFVEGLSFDDLIVRRETKVESKIKTSVWGKDSLTVYAASIAQSLGNEGVVLQNQLLKGDYEG